MHLRWFRPCCTIHTQLQLDFCKSRCKAFTLQTKYIKDRLHFIYCETAYTVPNGIHDVRILTTLDMRVQGNISACGPVIAVGFQGPNSQQSQDPSIVCSVHLINLQYTFRNMHNCQALLCLWGLVLVDYPYYGRVLTASGPLFTRLIISGRTSYREISWTLEAARFGFIIFQSLWNLTGIPAAALPRCLSNFRAIQSL